MKKIISILIVLTMCLGMLSCKSTQGGHCDAYGRAQQNELKDVG